jgi:hypothetical protein
MMYNYVSRHLGTGSHVDEAVRLSRKRASGDLGAAADITEALVLLFCLTTEMGARQDNSSHEKIPNCFTQCVVGRVPSPAV